MKFGRSFAISRHLVSAAFALLLLTVSFAPLPFGANGPESTWLLVLAAGGDPWPAVSAPRLWVAAGCFGAFALWAVVQALPFMPGSLPHPLWTESAKVLALAPRPTISIDPLMTWQALAKTLAYLCIGTAALFLLNDPSRRRLATALLVAAGGLYALYGIVQLFGGDCCVAWQKKTAYFGAATGPFINRNSFATYLGLIVLVSLGLLLRAWGEFRGAAAGSWTRRIAIRLRLFPPSHWLTAIAMLAATLALFLTQSRAGITATALGALVLVALSAQAEVFGSRRRRLFYVAVFAGIVTLAVLLIGRGFVARVASEGVEEADRTQSWQIVVTGIEASPWLGHGFGTFAQSFPLYRDDRLASRRFWDKAQDTYLELAIDTGIPATLVLLAGFAALLAQCWKGLSRRRRGRRVFPALGIAATILVGAHAIYDFSMQIPAIAATYAFVMAIALTESGMWRGASRPGGTGDQPSAT